MSDYDSEVFSSGVRDSDVYSLADESHYSGETDYSSDPADLSPSDSAPDARSLQLDSPTEIWDSDHSLNLNLLPDDSDQSEGPGDIDDHYGSSDPDDEILSDNTPCGLHESHFQLLCEGSEVSLIEGMILIFQYALK